MKAKLTILEVMTDRKILGKLFGEKMGRDTWAAWKTFLSALFGLVLTAEQREVYERHTGRSDAPARQFREAYVIAGRRSGKSSVAALIAVFLAIFRDYSGELQAGEIGEVQVLASDRKQAQVIFRYVDAFLKIPLLKHMVLERLKESILLDNHIRIVIRTSSFKSIRGFTVVACIADEVAFWEDADSANPAAAVLAAIRPAMSTISNPLLIAISSPYSRRGVLWDAYREHYGKESKVLVWKASSEAMNSTLDAEMVADAYARDPSAARAEYGAEFREDVEDIFSQEILEARIIPGRKELPPDAERSYFAFVDPSGGKGDSMTLGIAHVGRDKAVLDLLREVQPPFSPELVAGEFAAVLRAYRVSEVTGDAYGGEWPREQFAKFGVNYRVGTENRSEIYLRLLPALMSSQVELLDHPRMVLQLVGLERRTSRGGRDSIDHPQGSHDDVANAAAGALGLVLATNSLGVLGFIELMKRKALAIQAGMLESFGAGRRQAPLPASVEEHLQRMPVVRVDNRAIQKAAEVKPKCPTCQKTELVIRMPVAGGWWCNQCHMSLDAEGTLTMDPEKKIIGVDCCGDAIDVFAKEKKPHATEVCGELRCRGCGKQSGHRAEDPIGGARRTRTGRWGFGQFAIQVEREPGAGKYGRFG